ncbi:MAG TPA: XdhC family protein [Caulobacteraceae bacterium]|nr:XdhC family protein [Caulobacteraceae bacterium]
MFNQALSPWTMPAWPHFGLESDVRPALARAMAGGRPSVLASLYAVDGAAPLGEGAQMLFDGGWQAGFLSGGCVEGDVALHAAQAAEDGRPRRLVYGRGGPADIQLLCGSRIELLLERIAPGDPAAERLVALGQARRMALWLTDGERRLCLAEGDDEATVPPDLRRTLDRAHQSPIPAGHTDAAVYRRYAPPFRLVVVGGDPTTLAIARLAADAGFDTALVRPKGPAEPPPIAGVRYFRGAVAEAFSDLGLDPWTAVAVATHDLIIDHDALALALPSPAGYVGALGSRRRLPERLDRLRAGGLSEAEVARLKAPIGLDIGARSPWQIAVSVVAEAIQALQAAEARRVWPGVLERA